MPGREWPNGFIEYGAVDHTIYQGSRRINIPIASP